MSNAWNVVGYTHHGSLYCTECIVVQQERCNEENEECPDDYYADTVVFDHDKWWDISLRSKQVLQCEQCFDVLATHTNPEAAHGVTARVTTVLEYKHESIEIGYQWRGGLSVNIFEYDHDRNDHEFDAIRFPIEEGSPTIDRVEAACDEHFLAHLDRMGV